MDKIKAVIVEDEALAVQNLRRKIGENCPGIEVVASYQTYEEALNGIQQAKPLLVFLDIGLDTHSGFDLLKRLKHLYFEVIFTTASREHYVNAIRAEAVDYLSKPFTDDELAEAVERAIGRIRKRMPPPQYLHVRGREKDQIIPLARIMFCKADDNFTNVHLADEKRPVLATETLRLVEERLPSAQFFRVHRSQCINRDYVKGISRAKGLAVVMKDGTELSIAREKEEQFYAWLGI